MPRPPGDLLRARHALAELAYYGDEYGVALARVLALFDVRGDQYLDEFRARVGAALAASRARVPDPG